MDRFKSILFACLMLTAWSMVVMNTLSSPTLPEFFESMPHLTLSGSSLY